MRSESKGARLVSVAKIRAQHRRDLYTLREASSQADNVRQSRRKAVAIAIRKAGGGKKGGAVGRGGQPRTESAAHLQQGCRFQRQSTKQREKGAVGMSDKARKVADCAFSKALLSHKNASASLPPRRAHSQRAITRTSCERTKLEVRCFRMGETRTSLVDLLWVTGENSHRGAEEKASA